MAFEEVAVLGTGAMGTVMAGLFARSGATTWLWGRDRALVAEISATRSNPRHLPWAELPDAVRVTCDHAMALERADLVVVAVPSAYLRATIAPMRVTERARVLSVVKGIEPDRFLAPSGVVEELWGGRPFAVLSGPGHAEELVEKLPASLVVAGGAPEFNLAVRDALDDRWLRIYTNSDLVGVELAGALKNVLAIAAGVCEGLGLGDNAKAALLTRGLVEFGRFLEAMGARPETTFGLAGVGDLLATCYSRHGRNRAVGVAIGRGALPEEAIGLSKNVAEGATTAKGLVALAQCRGVELPIAQEVANVLYEGKAPRDALGDLMQRALREEGP